MKGKNVFLMSAVLLSVFVMCHSGDDDDDNNGHHEKKFRSAGVPGVSDVLIPGKMNHVRERRSFAWDCREGEAQKHGTGSFLAGTETMFFKTGRHPQ